jgi:starch-binding outer membrane protein, SusD/RagB family
MKRHFFKIGIALLLMISLVTACTKKLDRFPTNDITSEVVYSTPSGYKQAFAKLYGAFALTGNQGPAGSGDVQGIDEGTSDFIRLLWWVQEITTDEAVVQAGWNDPGIHNFHSMNWSSDNVIIKGIYYRSYYQITLCNDFINQSADDKLAGRNITGTQADEIRGFRAEARFLRAYQYAVIVDLFGKGPFVTEKDVIGGSLPVEKSRVDLFNYAESELKALEAILPAPRTNEYGRADRAAVWALLARLYLNAQVYTGTARYADAMTYSKKVIDAGYTLIPDYRQLMLADNHTNKSEFILTINYDGKRTQNYGGTTFLTHASNGGSMPPSLSGVGGGWAGVRTTKRLPELFPDVTGAADKRAQFYTAGQTLELSAEPAPSFTEGYAVTKYRNVTKAGAQGTDPDFADVDFPIFRLGEMYLVYAEAAFRSQTDLAGAVNYINLLRTRAYGNPNSNIGQAQLTEQFLIDERGRELYWECFRRSDLIRFGRFTEGTYLWPWKGGVSSGTAVSSHRKLFPIPSSDISSNSNLTQNPGY